MGQRGLTGREGVLDCLYDKLLVGQSASFLRGAFLSARSKSVAEGLEHDFLG